MSEELKIKRGSGSFKLRGSPESTNTNEGVLVGSPTKNSSTSTTSHATVRRKSVTMGTPMKGAEVQIFEPVKEVRVDSDSSDDDVVAVNMEHMLQKKEITQAARKLAMKLGFTFSVKTKRDCLMGWKMIVEAKKLVTVSTSFVSNCSYCSSELLRLQREGKTDADLLKDKSLCRFCKSQLIVEGKQEILDEDYAMSRWRNTHKKPQKIIQTDIELQLERERMLHHNKIQEFVTVTQEAEDREARLKDHLHLVDEGNRRLEEHKFEQEKRRVIAERKRMVEQFKSQISKMLRSGAKVNGMVLFDHMFQALREEKSKSNQDGEKLARLRERGLAAPLLLSDVIPAKEEPSQITGISRPKMMKLISGFETFAHLSENAKNTVAKSASMMRYPKGATLPESSTHMYCLCEGETDVYIDEKWANRVDAGKIFGDVGSETARSTRPQTVICGTSVKALVIPKEVLNGVLESKDEIMAVIESLAMSCDETDASDRQALLAEEIQSVAVPTHRASAQVPSDPVKPRRLDLKSRRREPQESNAPLSGPEALSNKKPEPEGHKLHASEQGAEQERHIPKRESMVPDTTSRAVSPEQPGKRLIHIHLPGLKFDLPDQPPREHPPVLLKAVEKPTIHHEIQEQHRARKVTAYSVRRPLSMTTVATIVGDNTESDLSKDKGVPSEPEPSKRPGVQIRGTIARGRTQFASPTASWEDPPNGNRSPPFGPFRKGTRGTSPFGNRESVESIVIDSRKATPIDSEASQSSQTKTTPQKRPATAPVFDAIVQINSGNDPHVRARISHSSSDTRARSATSIRLTALEQIKTAYSSESFKGGCEMLVSGVSFESSIASEASNTSFASLEGQCYRPVSRATESRMASLVQEGIRNSHAFHLRAIKSHWDHTDVELRQESFPRQSSESNGMGKPPAGRTSPTPARAPRESFLAQVRPHPPTHPRSLRTEPDTLPVQVGCASELLGSACCCSLIRLNFTVGLVTRRAAGGDHGQRDHNPSGSLMTPAPRSQPTRQPLQFVTQLAQRDNGAVESLWSVVDRLKAHN